MALPILRYVHQGSEYWGLKQDDYVFPLQLACNTTQQLIALGYQAIEDAVQNDKKLEISSIELLSPITKDAKVLCQGANYRQHMIDSGMNPDDKNFNMFFTKSSASITSPQGKIVRPNHVSLLDYEVELTLVLGKETQSEVTVTENNLHEYVAGICIGNDISARDVQIPEMQFHKGKSYRTFCPLGPVLCLLKKEEIHYLNSLQLKLMVNGEVRQQDNTRNLVHKPAATLSEFSQIVDFKPGDVVLTGTPSGCALGLPSPLLIRIAALLPEQLKWKLFIKKQLQRTQYLQPGDKVESEIHSEDNKIQLGIQSHTVTVQGTSS